MPTRRAISEIERNWRLRMRLLEGDIEIIRIQGDESKLEMVTEGGIDRVQTSVEKEIGAGIVSEERKIGAGKVPKADTALPVDILGQESEAIIMARHEENEAGPVSEGIGGIENCR